MTKPSKLWRVADSRPELAADLARALDISPVVAQVLVNRGIADEPAARAFLDGGIEALHDPFIMADMDKAVERIGRAMADAEKITVYGDYDVDGVTATSLLVRFLRQMGGVVDYYIPERQSEGYGLNQSALESLYAGGTKLVITLDCGISAAAEVAALVGRMDVVVTDHHQPPAELPPACAILNPKRPDCPYPEKNLAGVGVAFKLCQALWRMRSGDALPYTGFLDIVAVGTVADIVALTGENRVLVKLGLAALAKTDNAGFKALIKLAGLDGVKLDAGKIGYVLAPRLNAAGRLGHASAGVELLITEDEELAAKLAADLDSENGRRQAVEKELLAAAEKQLAGYDPAVEKVLVLSGEDWHPGVIGIVASRLVDRYYRPVVMISIREGIGKGSCRSIPAFDIHSALGQCADLLLQFGGHRQAAGLSVDPANIAILRTKLNEIASDTLTDADFLPVLNIDTRVALDEVDAALVQQLACLAPHGMGNPSPVLVCEDIAVRMVKPVGQQGRHLRLKVGKRRTNSDVIAWDMGGLAGSLGTDISIDLAFFPEINEWQGQRSVQLKAHDLHLRSPGRGLVTLTDARASGDKPAYIAREAGQRSLILVNNRREAVRLAWRLRRDLLFRVCGCWHPFLPASRQRRLGERLAAGARCAIVATTDYPPGPAGFTDIFFYSPPAVKATIEAWCRRTAAGESPVNIHFIYGAADIAAAGEALAAAHPDRDAVAWVYLAVKAAAGPDGEFCASPRRLAREASARSGLVIAEETVAAAIEILTELGLVKYDGTSSRLQAAPAQKLALEKSAAFRRGRQAKAAFSELAGRLAGAALSQLCKYGFIGNNL